MSEIILANLRNKLNEVSNGLPVDVETERNVLKEELQFYVLNFIYHHAEYGRWIMYGGSALRICHGLDRMSVDLDGFKLVSFMPEKEDGDKENVTKAET